jgi:outer membrane protein TolC
MLYAIARKQDSLKVQLQGTYRAWTDYTYHYSDVEEGEWDLLLYVEIPLVDGGKKRANIQKNRHLLEEAEKRLEAAREQVRKEYRKARNDWESGANNVAVLRQQQEYARKNLEDTLTLYRERLTDVFDLMDALEKDEQARTQLLDAQLNMFLARSKMREQQGAYLARISEREATSLSELPEEEHAGIRK